MTSGRFSRGMVAAQFSSTTEADTMEAASACAATIVPWCHGIAAFDPHHSPPGCNACCNELGTQMKVVGKMSQTFVCIAVSCYPADHLPYMADLFHESFHFGCG